MLRRRRLAGVRVQQVKLLTFVISGGAAALGGIIDASRVLSAQSSNGGTTLTFTVLAGIVVGGTSILGGEGAIWRTVVGTLFIAIIGNGFVLAAINPLYEQITLGVILLIAVGADAWSRVRTSLAKAPIARSRCHGVPNPHPLSASLCPKPAPGPAAQFCEACAAGSGCQILPHQRRQRVRAGRSAAGAGGGGAERAGGAAGAGGA